MKQFKLLNNIFGWVAFVIAATTYLITMEPTASFWDCGEFISTAFKLDVGHPPGAPFFMLTGRFFSLFASDPTQVALMINTLSALASAFTILFLFWTITHLARKVVAKTEEEYTLANVIGILGSGMVGALAYTFSDTFWFSAVEGEVYAYSSLFTAVVFWAILKWENVAGLRLYVTAQNALTFTKYPGLDPEIQANANDTRGLGISSDLAVGIDWGTVPAPRTFIAGLKIDF